MTSRKIYTKIVMDMKSPDLDVIEEDYYYYNGPIALCQEGEGEGSDDSDDEDKDKPQEPSLTDIKQMIQQVGEGMQANQKAINEIKDQFSEQQKDKGEDEGKGKEGSKDGAYQDPSNLEIMDRKEYAEYIVGRVQEMFKDQFEEQGKRVQTVEHETTKEKLQREAEKLREQYKDFDEWRDEMRNLFQKNYMLSLNEAYTLARAQNPKKAKEVDKKYEEKKESEEDKFGGLTPVQKKREKAKQENLKGQDAVNKAWEIVIGNQDDIT